MLHLTNHNNMNPKLLTQQYEPQTSNNRQGFYGLWCVTPLSQHFSYIVAVSFIGGGNRSTRRKPPTCC
jgi:hypothetical protein